MKNETNEEQLKKFCDEVVRNAASLCLDHGASLDLTLDRMLTFAAAQAVVSSDSASTAQSFRQMADHIDAGVFAHFEEQSEAVH